jgi:hypothetical protein
LAKNDEGQAVLASAGLILFNATASYQLLRNSFSLDSVLNRYNKHGTWKLALREAFQEANDIDYEAIFLYAIRVLDSLPSNPSSEAALGDIYKTSEYVSSRAGLLKHDLAGRVYHSALGRDLAQAYATYYTGIPSGELLAWISVRKWDDRVADFACGSGTLLLASYHKKLSVAFLDPAQNLTVDELHKRFVEEDIIGLDAMPFAAHLTLVNLSMQQSRVVFKKSNILHVPVRKGKKPPRGNRVGARLGSLDLLRPGVSTIQVQQRMSGANIGPTSKTLRVKSGNAEFGIPPESIDVVIMNPPFTKKQRVSAILDETELRKILSSIDSKYTSYGGLTLPFILLGDKFLKPGGRLALVLPAPVLQRDTMYGVRELLFEKYDVEHIVISWIGEGLSFSENTDIREVLLVARKRDNGQRGSGYTLVTHIDESFTFMDARQIADLLLAAEKSPSIISIKSKNRQPVLIGLKQIGEVVSFPRTLLEETMDDWYALVAFRNSELVKSALVQLSMLYDYKPPYGLNLSKHLSPLSEQGSKSKIAEVGLFVKQVESAGFRELNSSAPGAVQALMTSDYGKMTLEDKHCSWLVKDPSLNASESFTPGLGHLLVPRKVNLTSTSKVFSIVSTKPVAGNMWMPIEPCSLTSQDGESISTEDVAKVVALWMQSTYGVLIYLSLRMEIGGIWSEWLTNQLRNLKVLDPSLLTKDQIRKMLQCWDIVSQYDWELLVEQLDLCSKSKTHPRRILDETILDVLSEKNVDLDKLYRDLKPDIELLRDIMR